RALGKELLGREFSGVSENEADERGDPSGEVLHPVSIPVNFRSPRRTEVLTVPAEIPADLTCRGADGQTTRLARCQRMEPEVQLRTKPTAIDNLSAQTTRIRVKEVLGSYEGDSWRDFELHIRAAGGVGSFGKRRSRMGCLGDSSRLGRQVIDCSRFGPELNFGLHSRALSFIARLGGAKALPKFKAKGYEYVVTFTATADTTDIRSTFEGIISVLCSDLQADDFISAKPTADNMMLTVNVPPVRRSRFTAELIFKHINKVLQSDSSVLGNNFKLFLLKAWVPRGGCGSLDAAERHIQARHSIGGRNYVVIANSDKRCLIRALVVAKAFADLEAKAITKQTWRTIKADSPLQTKLTGELQIAAKLYSDGPFGVDVLPQLLAALNAQSPGRDFGVRVYGAEEGNTCVYALPGSTVLNLHLIGEHFNAVCKVPPFFGARRYCDRCQQPYDCKSREHKCANTCPQCKVPGTDCKSLQRDYKRCADCGLKCYNQQCFENHRRKNRAGRSRCDSVRVCPKCGYCEDLKVGQKEPEHKCGHVKCPLCKQYDEAGSHLCFVKAPKVKASTMPYVFYDTETYTDEEKQHHVHLVTAVTCCETCSGRAFPRETCRLCNGLHSAANCLTGRDLGEEFSNCVSHSDCACQMADFVAVGPASLNAFFTWLSTTFRGGAIVVAHNASGYDAFLLLGALLNGLAKKRPQVLFQGSRLMSMTVDKLVFKDSLNFIPIPLAQFPKALGLADTKLAKGTFPHEFNKPANWNYVAPTRLLNIMAAKQTRITAPSVLGWPRDRASQYDCQFGNGRFTTKFMEPNSVGVIARQADQQSFKARNVRTIWEHEYDTVLASQADFIAATAHLRAPLKMEDALYGGRVECFIPHAVASETETLKYRDVVSLYPTVQSKDPYPIGHPVQHPTPQTLNSDALASYFGIAKVTVLPPSDLHIPLLPYRVQKKLFFGLCRTCMEQQQCGGCDHSDQERALTGTWATPELQKAFQLGYRLQAVHALAYWTEKRTGLFGDYVNAFLKLKAESSGSPGMSDEDKAAYIADFYAKEGVTLDKVEPNPGLRFVAKIFLNSLWGKFCQRDDLTSTEIVSSYEDWLARLTDPNLKVKACEPIGSEFMLLEYRHRYFNQRLVRSFTGIPRANGSRPMARASECGPMRCRRQPDDRLCKWGAQALHLHCRGCGGVHSQVLKCKGIRLTPEIRERSDDLRNTLLHGGSLQLPQFQFRRDKASCTIHTVSMDKTFQRVLTKRSEALPDRQRARLWQAVVETVLLYNAETWTLTATLERQLDLADTGLLRAAFRVDESVGTEALYDRAKLQRPFIILRR
uniref:DNA-directed DNA polymerase n=1 Tax=Macrostomum lignano TaxID=282301 RepID=A0A1I8I145_9PLAT